MQEYLYSILVVCLLGAAAFGYYYYRDFFAAEDHPSEWWLLYIGLVVTALAVGVEVLMVFFEYQLQNIILIGRLAGAGAILVAGFIFWHKFRL